ncbi:InlB B-repeat-containing protein [Marinimicrobium sp. ABcell2]|uniref:InlB B-repeat-containing protein n=1 Tax=Marinimicrobium sp. ABcell2 TaxID=3069751 RepID=UPI0027B0E8E4|nr:InlB B-repeat-containing protein [Marinimicrobium sp. ABcell2]MDQ2076131.1 InlB B-repeat-containing protein [Marinimicrobium sp. ABcell2]
MPPSRLTSWLFFFILFGFLTACGGSSNPEPGNTPTPTPPPPPSAVNFVVSYSAEIDGTIEGAAQQNVEEGADGIEVTAVPAEGYYFVSWSDGREDNPRTDTDIRYDLSVSASFARKQYTLNYIAGENGRIQGETTQRVFHGGDGQEVIAIADEGYEFMGWNDAADSSSRIDQNVTESLELYASFAFVHTATYSVEFGGMVQGRTTQFVTDGADTSAVTAVPFEGYQFTSWSDGSTANPRVDNQLVSSLSVMAQFTPDQYTLAYATGQGGSLAGQVVQEVTHGSDGSELIAIPEEGYHFIGWSDGRTVNPRIDVRVTGDLSVTAYFAPSEYILSYDAGENGSLKGDTLQNVVHGLDGTKVTAVPAENYQFEGWSDGRTDNPRTDTNVMGTLSVTAYFYRNEYTLSYSAGAGGTLDGQTDQYVLKGANGTALTAVPDKKYHFVNWSDGRTDNPRIDQMVTENLFVTANFEIVEYSLTYAAAENGSLQGDTNQRVIIGSNGSPVTALPEVNYQFVHWNDGRTDNPRSDHDVTENLSVKAIFSRPEYSVNYTASANGTLLGEIEQQVLHGSSGTAVTAVPAETYRFVSWSDGRTDNPRTDTHVMEDRSITAYFALKEYTLNYSTDGNGVVQGSAKQQVPHGSNGSAVTAAPNEGYHFTSWSDGRTDNPRTDLEIIESLIVGAKFSINEYTLSYSAGANGSLGGEPLQKVTHGSSGGTIVAIPDEGFQFIEWSDGKAAISRTDSNVRGDVNVTARFGQTPWAEKGHYGGLQAKVTSSQSAILNWPTDDVDSYNLIIANSPTTDIQNYASFGATLEVDVTSPIELKGLEAGAPVYVALETNGVITAWSSFTPRKVDPKRIAGLHTLAIDTDGTHYVGGSFTQVGSPTGSGVGLPPAADGAQHALAWPFVNGDVYASVPDGEGGWYIGGHFTEVGGEPRYSLAQIDRMGRVTPWAPRTTLSDASPGIVRAIALYEEVIYVGGWFSYVDGKPSRTLASFSREGDVLGWKGSVSGEVNALAIENDVVYVGGDFWFAGGESRRRLAAFTLEGDLLLWNPGADRSVQSLAVKSGTIYVGGRFESIGETSQSYLAAIDEAGNVLPWKPTGVWSSVYSLVIKDDVLYVGGNHVLKAFDADGTVVWEPANDFMWHMVHSLAVDNGIVYAGGNLTGKWYPRRPYLVAFDDEAEILSWDPAPNGEVYSLAVSGGVVYAGGKFSSVGGEQRDRLAAVSSSGELLPWNPGTSGPVNSLTLINGDIYSGGSFSTAGGVSRGNLAAFTAQGDLLPWSPSTGRTVLSLAYDDNAVYVGGLFTSANGQPRERLAAFDFDGELLPWDPGADDLVRTLVVGDGVIYAGGSFMSAGGEPRERLAAFNFAGDVLPWSPGAGRTVRSLVFNDGVLYAAGEFTDAGGFPRDRLAAFNTAGSLTPWNPSASSEVSRLIIDGEEISAAGDFSFAGGEPRFRFAVFDFEGNVLNR